MIQRIIYGMAARGKAPGLACSTRSPGPAPDHRQPRGTEPDFPGLALGPPDGPAIRTKRHNFTQSRNEFTPDSGRARQPPPAPWAWSRQDRAGRNHASKPAGPLPEALAHPPERDPVPPSRESLDSTDAPGWRLGGPKVIHIFIHRLEVIHRESELSSGLY